MFMLDKKYLFHFLHSFSVFYFIQIVDYGDDTGSANVVKLCGNFLIASSIESIAEAVALSEKNVSQR